jgi:hypothetical protein
LSNTTGDVLDRAASGRFVRNLALSLSGGALIALAGAGVAHAQGVAGTASSGSGATGTGDATAVGNHSGSNTTQGGTVSGGLGSIQVLNQTGVITNSGVAVADTGHNTAKGNTSNNTATATQTGVGGAGAAVNNGQANNGSDGAAFVHTGNASAVGNQSTTVLNQTMSARGALGGILVLNQTAGVTNSGRALAGTGRNTATGNNSNNNAGLLQNFDLANGLGSNSGQATNGSDGKATISTGNASAVGNLSGSSVTQSSTGAAGGDDGGGGLILIPQTAAVVNRGEARATTGRNTATGNVSSNGANVDQNIGTKAVPFFPNPGTGVASNSGTASSWSNGTAGITTGDAGAVGNQSNSDVRQWAGSDLTKHGGLTLLPQGAIVANIGEATARTGGNTATGNASQNPGGGKGGADVDQDTSPSAFLTRTFAPGLVNTGVASNSAQGTNQSNGRATIATGGAFAAGNRSRTTLSQASTADASTLNVYPQLAAVANRGEATARTGGNTATGNDSTNNSYTTQDDALPTNGLNNAVLSNSAKSSNTSDGAASITTGGASAVGNESRTALSQNIDPIGLVLPVQAALVVNAGTALAQTGGNTAEGNGSTNASTVNQLALPFGSSTPDPMVTAGLVVAANQAEASNTSDGTASINTGTAAATGNQSNTWLGQTSTGTVDGLGLVVNTQAAAVAHIGAGIATTGGNTATGNESNNVVNGGAANAQIAEIGGFSGAASSFTTGIATVANSETGPNTSDGTATIETGDARASGNRSATRLGQSETATVSGIGGVINTQAAVVANAGLGVANTGGNTANGNISNNNAQFVQEAGIGGLNPAGATVVAGSLTAANSGSVSNGSDGRADVGTGSADALGNASATDLFQRTDGDVAGLGLVLSTQVGAVANIGAGVANSGGNNATGNMSTNANANGAPGASAFQVSLIGEGNKGATTLTVFGPVVAANEAEASNASDGTGRVRTGGAQAQGNVSTTSLTQAEDGTIDKVGASVNSQVGGVANIGIGVANSGLNTAIGNMSNNGGTTTLTGIPTPGAGLEQEAVIESANVTGGTPTLTVFGPVTANNAGKAANSSDGTASVGTGGALASGNVSATSVYQHQTSEVTDLGLVVNTQVGGVANLGAGIANSGLNAAVGNASGAISPTLGTGISNTAAASQNALFVSKAATPTSPLTVVGPVVAANDGEATNSSDGTACVCTGNAVASGNISSTTLVQDLNTTVGTGTVVMTEAGGVLNAGLGVANSGLNLALGNISQNTATATQTNTANAGLPSGGTVGPQVVHSGGGADNTSDGTGKVGTGNASATGNESTTDFVQAAAVSSDFAVAALAGGTTNTGLGLANAGLNLGVGNASVNDATLDQTADGAGVVSSDGTASNSSDGSALIGNPNCIVPGTPATPGKPGAPSLPKTGAPIEVEAAIGLMLLLAGFGLRRRGSKLGDELAAIFD